MTRDPLERALNAADAAWALAIPWTEENAMSDALDAAGRIPQGVSRAEAVRTGLAAYHSAGDGTTTPMQRALTAVAGSRPGQGSPHPLIADPPRELSEAGRARWTQAREDRWAQDCEDLMAGTGENLPGRKIIVGEQSVFEAARAATSSEPAWIMSGLRGHAIAVIIPPEDYRPPGDPAAQRSDADVLRAAADILTARYPAATWQRAGGLFQAAGVLRAEADDIEAPGPGQDTR